MKQIHFTPTFLSKLRNAEHFDLMDYVDTTVPLTAINPSGLQPARNTFHLTFVKEDDIYKRAAKREETPHIVAAHEKRKGSYMGAKYLVEAASYSPVPSLREAANLLLGMMDNYKSVHNAPMNEASALYTNLVQDFNKTGHAAAMALIPSVGEAVSQLDADNEAFKAIYHARAQGEEEAKEEGSLREARKATDLAFTALTEGINAFYHANEMLGAAKDQEVSESLGKAITDINAYVHQHEDTYARRNPRYHAGDDKPSRPGEDIPGEDIPAEPAIPEFSIAEQESLGNSTVMPGYGSQMSLHAVDPQAFADVLYPEARGGVLRLTWPGTENGENFPVADFLFDTDGTTPIGLVADAPAAWGIYKPFNGTGLADAEVIKDGIVLARLLDVQFPAMMGED
jgi:hypothetical protein